MNRTHLSVRAEFPRDSGRWRQYYTCFTLSVLCTSKGLSSAWTSPMIQILQSNDSPVGKLTDSEINTLQTITQISGIVGVAVLVFTLFRFGNRNSAYVQSVLTTVGFLTLLFASSPTVLYVGRFLTGTTGIGLDVVSAFLLSEVSHDCRRGLLIGLAMFASSFGTLVGFALGTFCGYKLFNALCLIPSAIFPLLFFPVRESPMHLIRTGRMEEAHSSVLWFHGVSTEIATDFIDAMRQTLKGFRLRPQVVFEAKANRKALLILFFLVAFTELCGIGVNNAYGSKIFEKAKGSLSPNDSAFLIAGVSFVSTLISAFLMDSLGRRFLSLTTLVVMSVSLYTVTAYFYIMENNPHPKPYQWMVYAGMGGFSAASTVLIGAVAQAIGAELVPAGVKGMLWMFAGVSSLLLSIASVQIYNLMTSHLPYYASFLEEAVVATAAVVIAWFIVPETKGKSLAQITAELSGERYDPEAARGVSAAHQSRRESDS